MQATTLSYNNMHLHGDLFPNLLRSRERRFIAREKWSLPQVDGMEFDQYDIPASRWIAVHENGEVLASMRLTPTTARCGVYSYMIRDAQLGLLPTIPKNLLQAEAPVSEHVWEASRVHISPAVPAKDRHRVHLALKEQIMKTACELDAQSLIAMVPVLGVEMIRRLGMDVQVAGPVIEIDADKMVCITVRVAPKVH